MSIILAALFMGIGVKMNEIGKSEGGAAPPPAGAALAFNYDLSSGSQFNLLWGGI